MCSRLVLQGENLDSDIWLLNPATTMLDHHSFLQVLLLKNLVVLVVSRHGWCRYDRCCSLSIVVLISLEGFLSHLSIALVLYDFAICWRVFVCVRWCW